MSSKLHYKHVNGKGVNLTENTEKGMRKLKMAIETLNPAALKLSGCEFVLAKCYVQTLPIVLKQS